MDEPNKTRRYPLAVVVAVVVLFASVTGVVAFAQPDGGDVFTGCLNETSGMLRNVAVGFEPARPCNDAEIPVTWDRAGPAFEARIAELEERVAELEEPFGTLEVFVDCDAGDTVGGALAGAETHAGPVRVAISGVCEENVGIFRDDVTLFGLQSSDGIRATSSMEHAVSVSNARGVRFENMTISGGAAGIEASSGSAFTADGVTVRDTTIWAIQVQVGSSASLGACTIVDNASFGVTASGGDVGIWSCSLSENSVGVFAEDGGSVWVFDSTMSDNDTGVLAFADGTIRVAGSTIESNRSGVASVVNSTIQVRDGSVILNNSESGAHANIGSSVNIEGTVIENNGAQGILVQASSTVQTWDVVIRNNAGNGIELRDLSHGTGGETQIQDNGGWGIDCAGPAAIADAQTSYGVGTIVFSGNTNGDTNCP